MSLPAGHSDSDVHESPPRSQQRPDETDRC